MAQSLLTQLLGLTDSSALNNGTLTINTANTRLVYAFIPPEGKTLSKVRAYVSGVNGTLGSSDLVCDLYSFPSGAQVTNSIGSSIESRGTVTATPTGAGWVEWTGFTSALTPGTQYGLVFRNANGTPAANNVTFRWTSGADAANLGTNLVGTFKKHSTDALSTFSGAVICIAGFRLEFSDASFLGIATENGGVTAVGDGVYSTRELGATFTTPADVKLRVRGIGARIGVTGSPTGSPRFRIYNGTTLLATTDSGVQYATAHYLILPFGTAGIQVIDPGTTLRIVLGETAQADASGNRFNLYEYHVENDANTKARFPFGGWIKTYYDGATWTDTDTRAPVIWMVLDSDDPFDSSGGGGGGGTGGVPILGGGVVR